MKKNRSIKVMMWIIIGIVFFFLIELLWSDVILATMKGEKSEDDLLPFYWLLLIVGGSIVCTLSYVSWRKYQGEKKEKQHRDNDKLID